MATGAKWVPYVPQWGSGEDGATDFGLASASTEDRKYGGHWEGENAPVAFGEVYENDQFGALFKGEDGYYFNNRTAGEMQKLDIDDATAQSWVGGRAEVNKQHQESEANSFMGKLDSFFQTYAPVVASAVAAYMTFGAIAGPSAGAGGTAAGAAEGAATAGAAGTAGGTGLNLAATGASGMSATASTGGLLTAPIATGTVGATGVGLSPALAGAGFNAGIAGIAGGATASMLEPVAEAAMPGGPAAAPAVSPTAGSKIVDWAAKQVINTGIKTAAATAIGGGSPDATPEQAPAPAPVSFGTFGQFTMPSTYTPVKRTKFQVDQAGLINSGIEYTP